MIIFDEKRYAEQMLKKGYLTKNRNVYELYILSKYYFSEGKSKDEVKKSLVEFCEKFDKNFNMDEWYKIINKTVSSAFMGRLITGKEAIITEKELNHISQIEKLNEQKVAFTLLVLYKFYGYRKFEISIEDLYRLSKLTLNSKTKLEILQSLTSQGLIDITMGGKRWVKFADKKGKPVIMITNFDDFIYEYLLHISEEGFCQCENCQKAIKLTSNRKKYCKDCWGEKKKELTKERVRKHRENKRVTL